MKIDRLIKRWIVVFAMVACALCLTACSSQESGAESLQLLVGSTYVPEETLDACTEEVLAAHPSWEEGEYPVEIFSMDFGSPETDIYAGANIAKFSAMVAAKEVDLMICDTENAARFARSEMFVPVEEILTEEELNQYGERLLTFPMVDEEGNPTGEETPAYGVAVDGGPWDPIYGDQEYGVFLISNAEPMDKASEMFLEIAAG